jgi:hypothetical protein
MAAFARFRVANCGPLFFTLPLRPHPVHRARWRSCHSTRLRLTGSRRPRTRTASTHCLEHYLCARPQEEARIIGPSNPVKTLRKSGGRTRTRTLDPLIKSQLFHFRDLSVTARAKITD